MANDRGCRKRSGKAVASLALLWLGLFFLLPAGQCFAVEPTPPTTQDANQGTFLLVKVHGTIGGDFTAADMKAALAQARRLKAGAIVLRIDTPGGSVHEAEAIVDLIIENKDLRFIAFVRKALSAGAAITLACKGIYVTDTATIGAAVSYIPGEEDLSDAVAEKFQSAWRAVCRKAADHGGHSSLLAEGMVDRAFSITRRMENGKVVLERDGKGKIVKASGRILTLTAKEAVACGLAKHVLSDFQSLGRELRMKPLEDLGASAAASEAARFGHEVFAKIEELQRQLAEQSFVDPKAPSILAWRKWYQNRVSEFARGDRYGRWSRAVEAYDLLELPRSQGRRAQWELLLNRCDDLRSAESRSMFAEATCRYAQRRTSASPGNSALAAGFFFYWRPVSWTSTGQVGEEAAIPHRDIIKGIVKTTPTLLVQAEVPDSPNVLVTACVEASLVDYIRNTPRGGEFTLSGRIRAVQLAVATETPKAARATIGSVFSSGKRTREQEWLPKPWVAGIEAKKLRVSILLEGCRAPRQERNGSQLKPSESDPVDPEAEAKQRLNLADTYASNWMTIQALRILRSIIEDFPDTAAAKKAAQQYKELEEDAKKAKKDS